MTRFEKVNSFIKFKNVHYDKKSIEKSTGRERCKYKLAGYPFKELDQFIFFVCASRPDAYHKATTIIFDESEWINRNPSYPSRLRGKSCIDVSRYELLTTIQVANKIIDRKNRFKYIAELTDSKFQELQEILPKTRRLHPPIGRDIKQLLASGLQVPDDILRELGL